MSESLKISSARRPSRCRQWLRWGGGLLLAAGVLGLPLLNLCLATPFGRGLVAKKVSAAMHLPVSVGSASYSPWGGVRLKGLRVEQVDEARRIVPDPFFAAESFEAELQLSSLWSDEVVIDRLICKAPAISMVRGEERAVAGGAVLAQGEGAPTPAMPLGEEENQSPGQLAADPPQGEGTGPGTATRAKPPAKAKAQRKIALGELEVRGGSVKVSSYDGETLLRIEGLEMRFDFSHGEGPGTLRFDRATIMDRLGVEDFVSPAEVSGRRMQLSGFEASCGGGELGGEIAFEYRPGMVPFVAKILAHEIEVAQLVDARALGLRSGKISSQLVLQGMAQSPRSIRGQGELRVESAVLEPGAEFEKLRSALQVDGAGQVTLDPARASFAIRDGNLALQEASFGSGQLLLKSVGGIGMDGTLNVSARLYLGADLYSAIRSKPVPGREELRFERLAGTDWFYRDELVTGTLASPLLDFWRTGVPVSAAEVMGELSFEFSDPRGDSIGR